MPNNSEKGKFVLGSAVVIVFVAAGFAAFDESNPPRAMVADSTSKGTNFNLIFRYGICRSPHWNELNTFEQTYTKDLVMDPPITTKLKLSEADLSGIYQQIDHLKLFDGSEAQPRGNMRLIPCSCFYLRVRANSDQKELSWNDCHGEISDKLQQFTHYIIQIIESNNEYKKLPNPRGGYM